MIRQNVKYSYHEIVLGLTHYKCGYQQWTALVRLPWVDTPQNSLTG